jgi:hypothetical protein
MVEAMGSFQGRGACSGSGITEMRSTQEEVQMEAPLVFSETIKVSLYFPFCSWFLFPSYYLPTTMHL